MINIYAEINIGAQKYNLDELLTNMIIIYLDRWRLTLISTFGLSLVGVEWHTEQNIRDSKSNLSIGLHTNPLTNNAIILISHFSMNN